MLLSWLGVGSFLFFIMLGKGETGIVVYFLLATVAFNLRICILLEWSGLRVEKQSAK
jgi:hypothetical protein